MFSENTNKFLLNTLSATTLIGSLFLAGCGEKKTEEPTVPAVKTEILSFFGAPGCGKGTIAEHLTKELNFETLSTGNLCRKHIQDQTEIGKELKKYVDAGQLAPDNIIANMVVEWLKERVGQNENIILDGFPRTQSQAEMFLKILNEDAAFKNASFKVVNFDVPNEEIVKRISNRLLCSNKECQATYSRLVKKPKTEGVCDVCGAPLIQREDDKAEVVQDRLKVFGQFKEELISFYKKANTIILDFKPAGKSLDEDFADFKKLIGK
jgi:adenylate kinase